MTQEQISLLRFLPIEGVAERLGLEVSRHKALCPFHNDHHASLSFNVRKNTYRCFVCGAHGGTIDLVMKGLKKDFREACEWLGGDGLQFTVYRLPSASKPKSFDAQRYEKFFERPWLSPEARKFLFEERRLDERVVRWCRLTSWRDRQGVNWLQIPYFDREGNLTGIQNRNLGLTPQAPSPEKRGGEAPRFRFPQGSECGIYNLPVLNRLHEGEPLWITEGASDCWAALSAGHKAIAIPSATLLKRKDLDQLLSFSSSLSLTFHMAPDRDEPGERLFLQLQKVLPNLEHHQLPLNCKDYSDYYLKLKIGSSESREQSQACLSSAEMKERGRSQN